MPIDHALALVQALCAMSAPGEPLRPMGLLSMQEKSALWCQVLRRTQALPVQAVHGMIAFRCRAPGQSIAAHAGADVWVLRVGEEWLDIIRPRVGEKAIIDRVVARSARQLQMPRHSVHGIRPTWTPLSDKDLDLVLTHRERTPGARLPAIPMSVMLESAVARLHAVSLHATTSMPSSSRHGPRL